MIDKIEEDEEEEHSTQFIQHKSTVMRNCVRQGRRSDWTHSLLGKNNSFSFYINF